MPLPRSVLQELATARLSEAERLIRAGHHAGAYYLAGYAMELGLKACIARQFVSEEIPDWSRDVRIHDVQRLTRIAGLEGSLQVARAVDPAFDRSWQVAAAWSPESRYDETVGLGSAVDPVEALSLDPGGVMSWIRRFW